MLPLLVLLLVVPAVRPRPPKPSAQVRAMLDSVNRQEDLNDLLEVHFDAVCSAIKSGQRVLGPGLTDVGAHPRVEKIIWATGCSLRALKLEGTGDRRTVHFLWEIEGRDALGGRVSERGEADGEVRLEKGQWRIARFDDATHQVVQRAAPRFTERAQQLGLAFPLTTDDLRLTNFHLGGLAVRDVDGDGRPDVIAIQDSGVWLFRNKGPGLSFTRELLLTASPGAVFTSVIAGDFDEDGDPDLVLTAVPSVYAWKLRNDGGKFVQAGRQPPSGPILSGLASDLDSDGHLDLVLLSYPDASMPSNYLKAENGEPIVLLKGDGKFGFTPWKLPRNALTHRWSLAAISADLLEQGRPQLYVANDFGNKDLWRFEADGGIRNVAAENALEDPGNGMSVDVGDLDGDGRLDLYVANMFSKAGTRVLNGATARPETMALLKKFAQGNTAYFATADGGFEEAGEAAGLNRGLWAYGSVMTDIDDDGRLEVAVANGFYSHPNRKDL